MRLGPLGGQSVQRFAAVGRDAHRPAFADEQPPHHLAGIQIILDDERAWRPRHGLEAVEQLGELQRDRPASSNIPRRRG